MVNNLKTLGNAHILVTGGAGFIGTEVCRQLAEIGANVTVIDNLVNGKRENINPFLGGKFRLEVTDIRDTEAVDGLMSGTDIVLHLACLGVRHSIHSPLENHAVNATATLTLLESARKHEVARFVNISSSEVYGTALTVPMSEQHPAWPHTVYGGGKLAGERYADAYWKTYGLPTVVLRPFNAFGPHSHHEGDSGEVIPKFMLRSLKGELLIIHGDGSQTRDFTYVSDTARGILLAAVSDKAVGRTINLGQGKEISINELARVVCAVTGQNDSNVVHEESRPGDVLRLYCDSSLAGELLGYAPQIDLRDGLDLLHKWYLASEQSVDELLANERTNTWNAPPSP